MLIQNVQEIREIPRIERIKAIETNPELASLDITMAGMVTFGGNENVFVARLSDIEYGAKVIRDRGVKPEIELFNGGGPSISLASDGVTISQPSSFPARTALATD